MPTFHFHVPAFMSVDRPPDVEYATIDELLANERIASWKSNPGLYRFVWDELTTGTWVLMAELSGGKEWWVVGYMSESHSRRAAPLG